MKGILLWPALLVATIIFIVIVSRLPSGTRVQNTGGHNASASQASAGTPSEVTEKDHFKGAESAEITIIEYGDFQCPFCAQYSPHLQRLTEEFEDDVRVVYRHLPLSSIHANAQPAAIASEAAALQGKFWEMHDMLFEKQSEWSEISDPSSLFEGYAEEIGLDVAQYRADFESNELQSVVSNQATEAFSIGLASTPSIFINGERFTAGSGDYNTLRDAVSSQQ